MRRKISADLLSWKNNDVKRLPLLIYGARQVGKTFSIKAFAEMYYDNYIYVNFDSDRVIGAYFGEDISPEYIVAMLSKYYQCEIEPERTLIVFDEIQSCARALASLKYFAELAPEYHVVGAGSLLGVAVNRDEFNFPVGKVNIKHMYPMSFEEYLWAYSEEMLAETIVQGFQLDKPLPKALHELGIRYYKDYLITGGMPGVVVNSLNKKSGVDDEVLRNNIILSYTSDMAKYASATDSLKARSAYESIPVQLAKVNKKFQYKMIKTGARASLFGDSIDWLTHAGLVQKCRRVSEGKAPIQAYEDLSAFKLYNSDIGLLCQQAGLTRYSIDQEITRQYMGGVTENYVGCELVAGGFPLFYWESNGRAEIDFIISMDGIPIPVEVKSGTNVRSRSLSEYIKRYSPPFGIRISEKNFGFANGVKSVPLYGVFCLRK